MQSGRLGVTVGLMPNTRSAEPKNTKQVREALVTQTQARGYHAMLRRDGCDGRPFRQFMERGELRKKELEVEDQRPFAKDRLKKLEQRGLRLAALLDAGIIHRRAQLAARCARAKASARPRYLFARCFRL